MKGVNTLRITILIFVLILLIQILAGAYLPNFTFINDKLSVAYRILGYFSFSGLILSILLYFKVYKTLTILLGVILLLIFLLGSILTIYPIDTTTAPIDITVLQTYEDGSKLIIREKINAKTNGTIRDTVLVKDLLIFRKILQ